MLFTEPLDNERSKEVGSGIMTSLAIHLSNTEGDPASISCMARSVGYLDFLMQDAMAGSRTGHLTLNTNLANQDGMPPSGAL